MIFSQDLLRLITAICVDQGVDGHRADIFMLKVAQTLAAYRGREEVSPADVREAATLVLPHRLRRQPFSESEMDENRLEETFRKHAEAMESRRAEPPPPQPGAAAPDGEEAVLVGEVMVAPGATFPVRPLELPPDRQVKKAPGSRTRTRSEDHTGRYVRPTLVKPAIPDLAIDATLRAAAPYQGLRQRGNLALAIREPDLRYKVREKRIGRNILFVVDASGSMGADERMMETKAAILSLLIDAYQKRERVGLIVFGGREARVALPFTRSVEMAQRYLTQPPHRRQDPPAPRPLPGPGAAAPGEGPASPGRLSPGPHHRRPGQPQPGKGRQAHGGGQGAGGADRDPGDQRPGAGHGAFRPLPGPGLPAGAEPHPGGPVPFGPEPEGPGGGGPHHRGPGGGRGPVTGRHRRQESILPSRTIDNYRRLSYRINTPRLPVGIVAPVG